MVIILNRRMKVFKRTLRRKRSCLVNFQTEDYRISIYLVLNTKFVVRTVARKIVA